MGLSIDCYDETNILTEKEISMVKQLLLTAADIEKLQDDMEVSVTFVDKNKIRALNRQYRNIDSATDVISFALEENDDIEHLPFRLLGDIIICVPIAKEQAKEYGHSFERELGFLAVHGFLHLLGYDHRTEEDEKVMFSKQKEILNEYGLQR